MPISADETIEDGFSEAPARAAGGRWLRTSSLLIGTPLQVGMVEIDAHAGSERPNGNGRQAGESCPIFLARGVSRLSICPWRSAWRL